MVCPLRLRAASLLAHLRRDYPRLLAIDNPENRPRGRLDRSANSYEFERDNQWPAC